MDLIVKICDSWSTLSRVKNWWKVLLFTVDSAVANRGYLMIGTWMSSPNCLWSLVQCTSIFNAGGTRRLPSRSVKRYLVSTRCGSRRSTSMFLFIPPTEDIMDSPRLVPSLIEPWQHVADVSPFQLFRLWLRSHGLQLSARHDAVVVFLCVVRPRGMDWIRWPI